MLDEEIDQYVFAYFLMNHAGSVNFGDQFLRREDFVGGFERLIDKAIEVFGLNACGPYLQVAEAFIAAMEQSKAFKIIEDPRAGAFYQFRLTAYQSMVKTLRDTNPIIHSAELVKEQLWEAAFRSFLDDPQLRLLPDAETFEIPASDRIVLRSDNVTDADSAAEALGELSLELHSDSNEVGDAFGDDRTIAISEVSLLQSMAMQPRIRVDSVISFARKTLLWIAEKAGSAGVGELAKKALALFIKWLSS